jgi:hypothetical protein
MNFSLEGNSFLPLRFKTLYIVSYCLLVLSCVIGVADLLELEYIMLRGVFVYITSGSSIVYTLILLITLYTTILEQYMRKVSVTDYHKLRKIYLLYYILYIVLEIVMYFQVLKIVEVLTKYARFRGISYGDLFNPILGYPVYHALQDYSGNLLIIVLCTVTSAKIWETPITFVFSRIYEVYSNRVEAESRELSRDTLKASTIKSRYFIITRASVRLISIFAYMIFYYVTPFCGVYFLILDPNTFWHVLFVRIVYTFLLFVFGLQCITYAKEEQFRFNVDSYLEDVKTTLYALCTLPGNAVRYLFDKTLEKRALLMSSLFVFLCYTHNLVTTIIKSIEDRARLAQEVSHVTSYANIFDKNLIFADLKRGLLTNLTLAPLFLGLILLEGAVTKILRRYNRQSIHYTFGFSILFLIIANGSVGVYYLGFISPFLLKRIWTFLNIGVRYSYYREIVKKPFNKSAVEKVAFMNFFTMNLGHLLRYVIDVLNLDPQPFLVIILGLISAASILYFLILRIDLKSTEVMDLYIGQTKTPIDGSRHTSTEPIVETTSDAKEDATEANETTEDVSTERINPVSNTNDELAVTSYEQTTGS